VSDAWFRYSDQPPPRVVKVRVLWEGREFVAARALDEKSGKEFWGEYRIKANGKPSADATPVRLQGTPELWQPLHPEMWSGRLPAPVTLAQAGRMHAERLSFTAAELAEEMERDRASVSREAHTSREPLQWWRDSSQVKIEQAPNLTLRMVEGRLMRAVYNCGSVAHARVQTSSLLSDLDDAIVRALAEKEAEDRAKGRLDIVPRMESTPADEGDFLTAMAWFAALGGPLDATSRERFMNRYRFTRAQHIVMYRAKNIPPSFDEIGVVCQISGTRARQVFEQAVSDAWRHAMGLAPRPGLRRRDLMVEVRERNRRAKREARA
jgi:hypothetical protein